MKSIDEPISENLPDQSDEDLIAKVATGSEEAFTLLVERYQRPIFNTIAKTIGDYSRAEELTQDTFLKVFKFAARYNRQYKFTTWIFTIAKNYAKNELRDRAIHARAYEIRDSDWSFEEDAAAKNRKNPEQEATSREMKARLEKAMGRLPANYRLAIVLSEYNGMDYAQISEIFGCPKGTVKSWVHRGKQLLASYVKDTEV